MKYIEGPFSTKTYREARADEEAGRDREWQLYRQEHRRKILKAWSDFGFEYAKAGGHGGGGTDYPGFDPPEGFGFIINAEGNFLVDASGVYLIAAINYA